MSRPGAPRRLVAPAVAGGLVLTLGLVACSGGSKAPAPPSATSATTTATASPAPTTPGLVPLRGGPVLGVKIDNTPSSRPRIGLNSADVVYVEPVEGGLTRLLAVFSSHLPAEVGPVRSGRESDIVILENYGRVALAYSGSSAYTRRALAKGPQINLSFDDSPRGYHRDRSRPAPYNVIGNTRELLARAGGSATPKDPGFRFGPALAGGTAATYVDARWPAARMRLVWDAKRKQYLVTTDGRPDIDADGRQHGASTVVVQHVQSRLSANRDVNGVRTPLVTLVGSGKVTVLRDGKAWTGTWSRTSATAPTRFTAAGKTIAFAPGGPVWVLLIAPGATATLG